MIRGGIRMEPHSIRMEWGGIRMIRVGISMIRGGIRMEPHSIRMECPRSTPRSTSTSTRGGILMAPHLHRCVFASPGSAHMQTKNACAHVHDLRADLHKNLRTDARKKTFGCAKANQKAKQLSRQNGNTQRGAASRHTAAEAAGRACAKGHAC